MYNLKIYLQKKSRPPSSRSVHVLFPEIEIKRQLREIFSTTD